MKHERKWWMKGGIAYMKWGFLETKIETNPQIGLVVYHYLNVVK
jgi:hypothetical protein